MVFPTPEIIKEAVAGSHVAVWRQPTYSRLGMFFFTLLLGWAGLHHVMLRAPLIAVLFMVGNYITSGYWLAYDLLQLAVSSEDDLNTYGLGSPFLFEYGIAVGMWQGGTAKERQQSKPGGSNAPTGSNVVAGSNIATGSNVAAGSNAPVRTQLGGYRQRGGAPTTVATDKGATEKGSKEKGSTDTSTEGTDKGKGTPDDGSLKDAAAKLVESILKLVLEWFLSKRKDPGPKSYDWDKNVNTFTHSWWVFLFLLSAPVGPVASALAGDMWSAVMHVFNPFFIVSSIIETLYVLFFPLEVFINGVSRPFPYVWLFTSIDADGQSEFIQRSKIAPSNPEDAYAMIKPFIDIAKQGMGIAEGMLAYVPLAAGGKVGSAVGDIGKAAMITAKAQAAAPKVQKGGSLQRGGGSLEPTKDALSLGVIGAVLLGGLFLGIGRNVFQGKDDSPPVAGRV